MAVITHADVVVAQQAAEDAEWLAALAWEQVERDTRTAREMEAVANRQWLLAERIAFQVGFRVIEEKGA